MPATEYEAAADRVAQHISEFEQKVVKLTFELSGEIARRFGELTALNLSDEDVDAEIGTFIKLRKAAVDAKLGPARHQLVRVLVQEGLLNKYKPGRANE